MIKQAPTILFILVANIVLLVHRVVPHQHLNGFASFTSQHLDHHDDSDYNKKTHHHYDKDHDEDENSHDCILKLTFFSPSESPKCEYKSLENSGERITAHALLFNYEN